MPSVDIEENIQQTKNKIEQFTHEVYRLQGMLQTFEGFKKGGLTIIDLPNDPTQEPNRPPVEELESTQEKPE